MKFLLKQSDIFAHFGMKQSVKQGASEEAADKASSVSVAEKDRRKSHHKVIESEELDADEQAMAEEAEEHEAAATVLTSQPSIVTGGQMRYDTATRPARSQEVTDHINWKD